MVHVVSFKFAFDYVKICKKSMLAHNYFCVHRLIIVKDSTRLSLLGGHNLFRNPEMIKLDVFSIVFLEITELSVTQKLAPAVRLIFCRVFLFMGQLLQGLD